MPLSEQYDRDTVDQAINQYIEIFYNLLPKEAAIAALAELSQLPEMRPDAQDYPPLPTLFQQELYQTKEIRDAIQQLSEIMQNRQPQDPQQYSYLPLALHPSNLGKLNLFSREPILNEGYPTGRYELIPRNRRPILDKDGHSTGQYEAKTITADDVHDYMRYKFADAACNAIALQEVRKFINALKDNKLYHKHFAEWVSTGTMPEAMRTFLLTNAMLKQEIRDALQASLELPNLKVFLPYFEKMSIDGIMSNLFLLPPSAFDKEMEANLGIVLYGFRFDEENRQIIYKIFETSPYKGVREKLKAQIQDPGEHFSYEVISSFLKIAETRQILDSYGRAMKANHGDLVTECERICKDYVLHLETTSEDQQLPLAKEQLVKLEEALETGRDFQLETGRYFLKEKAFHDWMRDFFASYFAADATDYFAAYSPEQNSLLTKLFYFVFDQKRVHIDDNWIYSIYRENPVQEGVVTIEPHHRNRIFLHALTLPVEKWTPVFHQTFNEILDLLDNSTDPAIFQEKRFSYPPQFIRQLRYLQDCYVRVLNGGEGSEPYRNAPFPMLYYPTLGAMGGLISVLSSLREEALLEIDWPQIRGFRGRSFGYLFQHLNLVQKNTVFEGIRRKGRWPQFINHSLDFYSILEHLNPEQRTYIFESAKDKLPQLIQTAVDVSNVFKFINPQERIFVFRAIKDRVPQLANTLIDIHLIAQALNPAQLTVFFESIKNKWMQSRGNGSRFYKILEPLNPEQKIAALEGVNGDLLECIEDVDDFQRVYELLTPQLKVAVFTDESIRNQLPRLVKTPEDFHILVSCLTPMQIPLFVEGVINRLPQLLIERGRRGLTARQDIIAILKYLTPPQIHVFLEAIKGAPPPYIFLPLIRDRNDFHMFFEPLNSLNPEQSSAASESMKLDLLQITGNVYEFKEYFKYFNVEQKTLFFESIKEKLLSRQMIKTGGDLSTICREFEPEQIDNLCKGLKVYIPDIIKSIFAFRHAMIELNPAQSAVVFEHIKTELREIIDDPKDLYNALHDLDPVQLTAAFEILKPALAKIIQTKEHLNYLLEHFPAQKILICENLKDLQQFINTPNDLAVFTDNEKTGIVNILLMRVLDNYIEARASEKNLSRYNKFVYSAQDKIMAAVQLKNAIIHGTAIEDKHIKPLASGELSKKIKAHLETFRPDMTLGQFLGEVKGSAPTI